MCNTATTTATGNSQTTNNQILNNQKLFKRRRRDESVTRTAKSMLVAGHSPGKVALILRLDPEYIAELAKTWNPRFRQSEKMNQFAVSRLTYQIFTDGADLSSICKLLNLGLFTVVTYLANEGIPRAEVMSRFPPETDPLVREYRKILKRHAHRKQKPLRLH